MAAPEETCAALVVRELVHCGGVCVCFANPGTTEMHIVAALEKQAQQQQPGMRSILCLHEAVATGAADGYARINSSPALVLLHLGPGLGNGLCNLHNAHRARSPVIVLVGEHATWHQAADPVLAQDIQALAATVSGAVLTIASPAQAASSVHAALALASTSGGNSSLLSSDGDKAAATTADVKPGSCPASKVVTLVLPHDVSWTPPPPLPAAPAATESHLRCLPRQLRLSESPAGWQFLADCAAALRAAPRGKAALLLGGAALLNDGDALSNAGRIAASLGAALLCEPLPGRINRGAGLPHCRRLPYFPQEAAAELAKFDTLLLLDVRRPVAQFGYKDGPSLLLSQSEAHIWELDHSIALPEALALLVQLVPGAADIRPGVNCGGMFVASAEAPALPLGHLTAAELCQTVAARQPPGTIMVDESLTSGGSYWEAAKGCPVFDHLCLTGGAIGSGPPLATGAAVAAPGRQVVNLQADGSAMYTLQALWTQAREGLKVLTIICANNSYAILKVEAMRQRTGNPSNLTSLASPELDFVALAQGMGVPGGRAETCEQLAQLTEQGLAAPGPFLIHAALRG